MLPLPLIDTHAHLDDERFAADLPAVLSRAEAAGVRAVLAVATTAASSRTVRGLADTYPLLWCSVGIQPNHAAEAEASDWDAVIALAEHPRVRALGETGLDRHWDFTPFAVQEEYFDRHLQLARRRQLPVVIHCREAEADVVRMLRQDFERHGPVRGVMHSFTGDQATAEACLHLGLYISFAGMVTYKSAGDLRAVAARVPLDRILVETDSPYLTPVPLRSKVQRNEPAHVVHTAACLAQVLGVPLAVFAEQSTRNAQALFGFSA